MKVFEVVSIFALLNALLVSETGWGRTLRTVRATDLDGKTWSELRSPDFEGLVVEFRQGDRLPVLLQAQGDLVESEESRPSMLLVRRSFWIRVESKAVLVSLDGSSFRPVNEVLGGNLSIGAGSAGDGVANAINVLFSATLK